MQVNYSGFFAVWWVKVLARPHPQVPRAGFWLLKKWIPNQMAVIGRILIPYPSVWYLVVYNMLG
jgi:hypothetical protein